MQDQVQNTFCDDLKQKTKTNHEESDRIVNWKLAVALTDMTLYGGVLADFYYVFKTIEDCLGQLVQHPVICPLAKVIVDLHRAEAFEKDLSFFLGPNWMGRVEPSLPAKEYCDRILAISENSPVLLIAYVHSMYLAILGGGKALKKVIQKTLGLVGNEGLAAYEVSDSEETCLRLGNELIDCINHLPLNAEEKERILDEKRRVFVMNNAIANNVKPTAKSFFRIIKIGLVILTAFSIIGAAIYAYNLCDLSLEKNHG
ncbi:hypothetical protein CAPTEDRAFT_187199 [Capitella teleta]|uniref:Heme oxygenase n=1 Tax=Capitella teleta TaxID=283909 RepID=R7VHR2_CAPTE|nr:hypothetical protein CAPTEDRAFT_187199 [Capitella teleta]|eukprot:ELU15215.1 hypothetical protein CAPTEDRAFT_187199 [Capitella teleta]